MQAKVVSMRVRPLGVTHLCFETDGILGDINLSLNPNSLGLLGATAPFFDFDLFYAELAARPTQPAAGSITFASNPTAGQTITLDGTTWTFVTALTTGNLLLIGATLAVTLTGAVTTLQASDDPHTLNFRFSATATGLVLTAATDGPAGNSLAFSTNVSGAKVSAPTLLGADPSRLLFDSLTIQAKVAPYALAALRAEPKKAALNKAVLLRQNTYFAKYANSDQIIARMRQYYFNPPDLGLPGLPNSFSKSYRLAALSDKRKANLRSSMPPMLTPTSKKANPGLLTTLSAICLRMSWVTATRHQARAPPSKASALSPVFPAHFFPIRTYHCRPTLGQLLPPNPWRSGPRQSGRSPRLQGLPRNGPRAGSPVLLLRRSSRFRNLSKVEQLFCGFEQFRVARRTDHDNKQ